MEKAPTGRLRVWPDSRQRRGNRRPSGWVTAQRMDLDRGVRARQGTALLDIIDRCLDRGVVVEGWARASVIGVELVTVDADVFVASFETYLRHAAAVERTALAEPPAQP